MTWDLKTWWVCFFFVEKMFQIRQRVLIPFCLRKVQCVFQSQKRTNWHIYFHSPIEILTWFSGVLYGMLSNCHLLLDTPRKTLLLIFKLNPKQSPKIPCSSWMPFACLNIVALFRRFNKTLHEVDQSLSQKQSILSKSHE